MREEKVRRIVRKGYAEIAKQEKSCCQPTASSNEETATYQLGKKIGYSEDELSSVPEGANLGLGCGNPVAMASLREGETVLDLGSGGGFDCFLAANKVGTEGKVIGVDMTPEMLDKARANARKGHYENVEFRLGEIENLPVADSSVDAVISNCVINLSPNKKRVFEEAFRSLRPGGRLMVSDMVLLKELPKAVKKSAKAYVGCLAGAVIKDQYLELIRSAGFEDVKVVDEMRLPVKYAIADPTAKAVVAEAQISKNELEDMISSVASVRVHAKKPE